MLVGTSAEHFGLRLPLTVTALAAVLTPRVGFTKRRPIAAAFARS